MTAPSHSKRVYLDTSVISALFDERALERQRMTENFWRNLKDQRVFISTLVQGEVEAAPNPLQIKLLEKLKDFSVLPISAESEELAQE